MPFVWDTSCSAAFRALRASLIDAPILAFQQETGQYILDTDASNFGLGGVLSQIQTTGSWWWRIVAEHLDLHSDDTALLNARCWRW